MTVRLSLGGLAITVPQRPDSAAQSRYHGTQQLHVVSKTLGAAPHNAGSLPFLILARCCQRL